MPRRVTVDENGFVILVESIPERQPPPKSKGKQTPVDRTKKLEWSEDKAGKSSRKPFTRKPLKTRPSFGSRDPWVSCPLCGSEVKERNLKKHLRKIHPAQHGSLPTNGSQPATEPSNKRQDQPERGAVNRRSEFARRLLRELHEEKTESKDKVRAASSTNTASKREAKKQAKSVAKAIASKQKKAEKLRAQIRAIDRELKKLAPGFHRIKIAGLESERGSLRAELRKLERAMLGNAFAKGRSTGRGARLGARTEQHKEDLLRERAENEYGGKYLGHMQREHGRFGSLPLYDDYGEESGA